MISPRKLLNMPLNVTKTRVSQSGKKNEQMIPSAMAINTFGSKPQSLNDFIGGLFQGLYSSFKPVDRLGEHRPRGADVHAHMPLAAGAEGLAVVEGQLRPVHERPRQSSHTRNEAWGRTGRMPGMRSGSHLQTKSTFSFT